ncbi:heparinase II/III family protein [Corynebacterium sp. Q4381]|uniref:heparinase II/III domain-containing protein n=1 Tax=Corynebacterium sp. Marseille-Q4381 TaxID=3121597 RepID=UPI002FE55275
MNKPMIRIQLAAASLSWLVGWAALLKDGFTSGQTVVTVAGIAVALSPIPVAWAVIDTVRRRDKAKDELVEKLRKEVRSKCDTETVELQVKPLKSAIADVKNTHKLENSQISNELMKLQRRVDEDEVALEQIQGSLEQSHARVDQIQTSTKRFQSQVDQTHSQHKILKSQATQTQRLTEKAYQTLDKLVASLHAVEGDLRSASLRILKLASRQGINVGQGLTKEELGELLLHSLKADDALAKGLLTREIESAPSDLSLTELRQLMKGLRHSGYLSESSKVMGWIAERSGKTSDTERAAIMKSEASLFEGAYMPQVELPIYRPYPESKVVVHLVGKSLPETQTGYTLRTHYTARAIAKLGVEPVIAVQAGGDGIEYSSIQSDFVDDIQYCTLAGPVRNTVPWDQWVEQNIVSFAELVCSLRPAVIHAHSDFFNALIAQYVGDRYGIPVVNETRGFWEESWLSRTMDAQGEAGFRELVEALGLPIAYTGRRALEAKLRSEAETVITLAQVMAEHIEKTADEYGLQRPRVKIVPNAVESRSFPVVGKDRDLLINLGLPEHSTIVGYISSIVEYEGIDTLIRGFYELLCAFKAFEDLCDACGLSLNDFQNESEASLDAIGAGHDRVLSGWHSFDQEVFAETAARLEAHLRDIFPEFYQESGFAADLLNDVVELANIPGSAVTSELRLVIVGDGAELENLRGLAVELGIDEYVVFTGRVPHEEILRFYGLIDVFVVPRKSSDVTELVTPLKPFEAMSTGRACVFSNVRALKEIADEAGCVEVFQADDHHSLAKTLLPMVSDPDTIRSMGSQSARWVRDARSWDLNAISYVEAYQELGMQTDLPEYASLFRDMTTQGRHPRLMLELLENAPCPKPTGWFTTTKLAASAEEIISEGWKMAKRPRILFEPGFDWMAPGKADRTWGFRLHRWEMVDPVLEEFYRTRNRDLLEWLLNFSLDWSRFDAQADEQESMAWYDMAMSLRMPRLARIMIYAAQSGYTNEVTLLLPTAVKHIREILKTSAFNANNNHGFFNASACLDWAKLLPSFPNADKLSDVGHRRLSSIVDSQFASDGGHLEHSPAYQLMLLSGFEGAISDELISDAALVQKIDRASYALGWMIQPDGHLVQFGDTDQIDVTVEEVGLSDPHARFIETDGAEGQPDTAQMMILPESGYAFVRSPQPDRVEQRRNSSYLAFQAGFHSRAHKHADDLTFTWFDKGREILVDSGKYGYFDLLSKDAPARLDGFYYGSPERQYVESTRAHNTVAIKGLDIERRNREPFGSALETCFEDNGTFILSGRVIHDNLEHWRRIELSPGRSLRVHDLIHTTEENQTVVSWFNIDGSALLQIEQESLLFHFPNEKWFLEVASNARLVEPVRGQHNPLRGWRSREEGSLEPTWNFGFECDTSSQVHIVTQFTIHDTEGMSISASESVPK